MSETRGGQRAPRESILLVPVSTEAGERVAVCPQQSRLGSPWAWHLPAWSREEARRGVGVGKAGGWLRGQLFTPASQLGANHRAGWNRQLD